jgi:hypothetical protein
MSILSAASVGRFESFQSAAVSRSDARANRKGIRFHHEGRLHSADADTKKARRTPGFSCDQVQRFKRLVLLMI